MELELKKERVKRKGKRLTKVTMWRPRTAKQVYLIYLMAGAVSLGVLKLMQVFAWALWALSF